VVLEREREREREFTRKACIATPCKANSNTAGRRHPEIHLPRSKAEHIVAHSCRYRPAVVV
jgi:hypothetical protein